MDDNFKCIYRILTAFEKSLDLPEFDIADISAKTLGVSETRRVKYLEMLANAGYITGVEFREDITGETDIIARNPLITIKGLEYLSENTIMQRIYKAMKGIKDIVR
ncbi:MAG: YjcQ family protein [Treponemataceae bacterium]|nr:YjcQ family protein [Treponemataceae bacterium]